MPAVVEAAGPGMIGRRPDAGTVIACIVETAPVTLVGRMQELRSHVHILPVHLLPVDNTDRMAAAAVVVDHRMLPPESDQEEDCC